MFINAFYVDFYYMFFRWIPPPWGWYKLNNDDSFLGNPGATGGGVIHNDKAEWIR